MASPLRSLPRRAAAAFTLIELLVVIAIIAILAALLFPVLANVRLASYQAVCVSNLKQLGGAIQQYAQDWDGVYPIGLDFADTSEKGREGWKYFPVDLAPNAHQTVEELAALPNRAGFVDQVLKPYSKTQQIWRCPADIGLHYQSILNADGSEFFHGDATNGDPAFDVYHMSYGYRTELGLVGWTVDQAKSISDLVVLSDMAGYWHTKFHRGSFDKDVADTSDTVNWGLNVLYGDGHVRTSSWDKYVRDWTNVGPYAEYYQQLINSPSTGGRLR